MPAQFLPVIIATINLMLLTFLGFYISTLNKEKKQLKQKEDELTKLEGQIDNNYHQTLDNTLNKERKILDDAAQQASTIITNSQYVNAAAKDLIEKAMQKMILDIENQAANSSSQYLNSYNNSLSQLSGKSLNEFQGITKKFEADMQTQMQQFRESLLPQLQKEIEDYKQQRFSQADKTINQIIQTVAQKTLNKSLSMDDHRTLIIESLQKSRKEGVFD